MNRHRFVLAAAALSASMVMGACAGGGASDTAGAAAAAEPAAGGGGAVNLFAYSVPKVGYDKIIPAFQATEAGKGVQFQQSYGGSGDQSRKVEAGADADFVNFSLEPDVTRLVDAGLVDKTWNANEYKGIPFGSLVTIVVREGNPKGIADWDGLLEPGVEVVTPNPFSSGGAKWNLLAPYATKSNGGADGAAGLAYIEQLVGEHVKVQPKSAREATEAFLQGSGDALLAYENEALFIEREGDPVEHVTPPHTFKIENPTAVVSKGKNAATAKAFNDFLFTPAAQKLWAEAGFRPVDPTVAAEFAKDFPEPEKLWTIADLGGWAQVDSTLFKKDVGDIAKIYDAATQ